MLSVFMLNVIMLNVIMLIYVMLNVVMLIVVMLNVIMLTDRAPSALPANIKLVRKSLPERNKCAFSPSHKLNPKSFYDSRRRHS
jgi:hypothetical protein